MLKSRGAPDRKIFVRPDNRAGLTESGYRPDRTLYSIVSDEGLFSELGNQDYKNNEAGFYHKVVKKYFRPAII